MLAHVILRDPVGTEFELTPGDLIGRLDSAALPLSDARVSEAHAMVSLREGKLQLLALRGGLAVGGEGVSAVTLVPGLVVQLARGVEIRVVSVSLPERVLAIEGLSPGPMMMPGVSSLLADPTPRLIRGWRESAVAWVFNAGEAFMLKEAGGEPRRIESGTTLTVGGVPLQFVWLAVARADQTVTRFRPDAPLVVVSHFDVVHLYRGGVCALVLGGKPARLLSELAGVGAPVAWVELARLLWPDDYDDTYLLRTRFDVVVARLRRKLRAADIRSELLTTDGSGHVSLVLNEGDRVDDRS